MRGVPWVLLASVLLGGAARGDAMDAPPPTSSTWSIETELLVWWLRNGRIPPLLTTGAELDQPTTSALYGNEKLDVNRHLGGRVTLSYWLDECQSLGFQASGFVLERNSRTYDVESDGSRLLARPFFETTTGTFAAEIIAGTNPDIGQLSGAFYGFTKNELFGEQGSVLVPLQRADGLRLDFLAGPYFLQMRERLELTATSKLMPDEAVIFGTKDTYKIYNRFYGGHIGIQGEMWQGSWFLAFHSQCALGATTHRINAFGDRETATPLVRDWHSQGFLVQPTNAGKSDNATVDVVYELGVKLGCQVTSWLRVQGGYTIIYWTNPIRAGDQLDVAMGPARPRIPFADDYFWAQGASAGVELSW